MTLPPTSLPETDATTVPQDPITPGRTVTEKQLELSNKEIYRSALIAVPTGVINADGSPEYLIQNAFQQSGGIAVDVQDQTTPPIDFYFIQPKAGPVADTLAVETAIDDTSIELNDSTGFADGDYIGLFESGGERYYFGEVVGAPVGNVLNLDTPVDYEFLINSNVLAFTREMNVDGSAIPQTFEVKGPGPGSDLRLDITRLIFIFTMSTAGDDSLFGNIVKLTKGLVFRRVDGETRNIWNAKTNGELANLAFDGTYTDKAGPGLFGYRVRYTLAGQDKHGVAVRLATGEGLEMINQDDLSTLSGLRIIASGHIVSDE